MELGQGLPGSKHDGFMVPIPKVDETSLIDRFPYASRLGSNDIPSDEEIEEIKEFLREPTKQVQEMETEILQIEGGSPSLRVRLDFLKSRHATLRKQVEACRSLIAITRRLPDDILLQIFYSCLPGTRNPVMGDNTLPPMLFTAICRRWRILALQTPKLWSAFDLGYVAYPTGRPDGRPRISKENLYLYVLPEWLARSGRSCPLTFSLRISTPANEDSRAQVQTTVTSCLNALIPLASRWKTVFLTGSNQLLSALWTLPPSAFQSLESLFLHMNYDDFPAVVPMFNAQNLRKVSLQHKSIDPRTLSLPWTRLTHLDIGGALSRTGPLIEPLSAALSMCQSLIYLGLDIDHGDSVNPMYMPNLKTLSLRRFARTEPPNVSKLFAESLQAPSLRQMSLRGFDNHSFQAVLSKLGRSIQSLEFSTELIQMDGFTDYFLHCPSLLSLSILRLQGWLNSFAANKKFYAAFSTKNEESDMDRPLCPLLQELRFDNFSSGTLLGLVAFLEKKQNADPDILLPLTNLSIDYLDDAYSEDIVRSALKPFITNGLRFEMRAGLEISDLPYEKKANRFYGYGSGFQYADCWMD